MKHINRTHSLPLNLMYNQQSNICKVSRPLEKLQSPIYFQLTRWRTGQGTKVIGQFSRLILFCATLTATFATLPLQKKEKSNTEFDILLLSPLLPLYHCKKEEKQHGIGHFTFTATFATLQKKEKNNTELDISCLFLQMKKLLFGAVLIDIQHEVIKSGCNLVRFINSLHRRGRDSDYVQSNNRKTVF